MKPEERSRLLLGATRSKAKMWEYDVPIEAHIELTQDPAKLFTLTIALLGDLAAEIGRGNSQTPEVAELKANLLFSAQFFDSYRQSRLNESLDSYVNLVGAAAYYLCDLPGSASVLAKTLSTTSLDVGADGIELLLHWVLLSPEYDDPVIQDGPLREFLVAMSRSVRTYLRLGAGEEQVRQYVRSLRTWAYAQGTPRQLLLADVLSAVLLRKLENATWLALPAYSGLASEQWHRALTKESSVRELWPAQHRLGQREVFRGLSAVVQMPTSAGKTKATEFIIRSAFLSGRASVAAVVTPFRALCREVREGLQVALRGEDVTVEEVSDAMQPDFDFFEAASQKLVLVITPEKLLYLLRQDASIASSIGLVILDEGHQFDSGTRGISYELLVTSLRMLLPPNVQKVLISAVVTNAAELALWLNGFANVVDGSGLVPTFRSVGFVSWKDMLGRVEYVTGKNLSEDEFFVPRVLAQVPLAKKSKRELERVFPSKKGGTDIALYLGLKLVSQGSVAIFCGRKDSATTIGKRAVEIFERDISLPSPASTCENQELQRLLFLLSQNLGSDSTGAKCAQLGIFLHHGNVPEGVRKAIEHAMSAGLIKFVVCTSTLAQGVNLPIRYLVVTTVYQGGEKIRTRDFHNLLGRVGRAGMHTEGSVIFADAAIRDRRGTKENWRWSQVVGLLKSENSEPTGSNLLSIFGPLQSDDEKHFIVMKPLDFVNFYVDDERDVSSLAAEIAGQHAASGFSTPDLEKQIAWRLHLIGAVEGFLLAHLSEVDVVSEGVRVAELAESTLAFHLAKAEDKQHIRDLFRILADNIRRKVPDPSRRQRFGRTLFGLRDNLRIEKWFKDHRDHLVEADTMEEQLASLWSLFEDSIGGIFQRFVGQQLVATMAQQWIEGVSFHRIWSDAKDKGLKLRWGTRSRKLEMEHVIEFCENSLAFEGTLLVGAICELFLAEGDELGGLVESLQLLQKRLRYGLQGRATISIFELGFCDRVVAQELARSLPFIFTSKVAVAATLRDNNSVVGAALEKFPSYFGAQLRCIVDAHA